MPGMKTMKIRELRRENCDWRSEVFMQQLSENGSLLLYTNHDQLWIEIYWALTGRSGSGWTRESRILRSLPAGAVRQLLWKTSYLWWEAMHSVRIDVARFSLRRGLLEDESTTRLDALVLQTARQLDQLAWCASDEDQGRIRTIG